MTWRLRRPAGRPERCQEGVTDAGAGDQARATGAGKAREDDPALARKGRLGRCPHDDQAPAINDPTTTCLLRGSEGGAPTTTCRL
jgi:hypothetical protein